MPSDQTPNYMKLGLNNDPFEAQKPFTILPASAVNASGSGTTTPPATDVKPSITGPSSWNSSSLPPSFNVAKGSNPFYYVEVATEADLFNEAAHGTERNDKNFFATWNDASTNYKLFEDPQYQLPQQVWDNLKTADKIYYRLGTTIDANWNGWMVTIEDEHAEDAPYFSTVQDSVSSENDSTTGDSSSSGSTDASGDNASSNADGSSGGDVTSDNSNASDSGSSTDDSGSSGTDASSGEDGSSTGDSSSGGSDTEDDSNAVKSDRYLVEA